MSERSPKHSAALRAGWYPQRVNVVELVMTEPPTLVLFQGASA